MFSWIISSEQTLSAADTARTAADTLHTASDSLAAGAHGGGAFDFNELLHHIYDAPKLELPWGYLHLPHFQLLGFEIVLTKHIVFLLFAALLLTVGLILAARSNTRNKVPKGFGNLVEILVVFIRDEIVLPNMGKGGLKYLPYLLTNFFFILVMNLLGLIPWGSSATGNINVTAGLAIIAFVMIQFSAIRAQGLGHFIAHLTGGTHWAMWPIMVPIEFLGLFIKPFALCIRLFANMTAGHIVILALIGLIFIFQNTAVGLVSVPLAVAVNLLELFVALVQAYIFTMLTSIFMGMGIQTEGHEGHEGHAQEHH